MMHSKVIHILMEFLDSSYRLIELAEGKPTKAKVNKTIRAVAKWKECAETLSTVDNIAAAEEMLAELQTIMETLGAKISSKVKKPAKSKGTYQPPSLTWVPMLTNTQVSARSPLWRSKHSP